VSRENREKQEAVSRALNRISAAARYYALQVKNEHLDVLDTGLPELRGLLSNCEQLSK